MAVTTVPTPQYPNVPQEPGTPALARSVDHPAASTPPAASGDAPGVAAAANASPGPQWGIFDTSNKPVIVPDSIIGFEFKRDFSTPDYPIEEGGFATYNKVAKPYEARFTMAKGGTVAARQAFVTLLESLTAGLTLYNVATPEYTWLNANIVHWDERRTADKGVSLLTVDVWLREVRVAPPPAFTNTKAVSGQAPRNGGTVQAQTPNFSQDQAVQAINFEAAGAF